MKTYTIPVLYTLSARMKIRAETLEAALIEAENLPLPTDGYYVEGSFEINRSVIPYLNDELSSEDKKQCYETI